MENQEWRLLKELPDISVGKIGYQDGQYVRFDSDTENYEPSFYEIDFVKSKPDWFEKVEPKDYNVFERLIKARDLISKERGDYYVYFDEDCLNFSSINSISRNINPFSFNDEQDLKRFIKENKEDLIKFFNM